MMPLVMCGPGLGWAFVGSGFSKLKPDPKLRVRLGLGLVRLEPRLHMQQLMNLIMHI